MSNSTGYTGLATKRLSRALWGDIPTHIRENPNRGIYFYDDFENHPALISAQSTGRYATYVQNSGTLKANATVSFANLECGVLEVAGNSTTQDEASLTTGGNTGAWLKCSDDSGEAFGLYFEARIKKASIASSPGTGFALGLSEEGLAAADTLADTTGAFASKDFIGFQVLPTAGATVNAIFRKAGQALVTVQAAIATMVADTYMKLGFRYQPWADRDKRIVFFIDGVEYRGAYVTSTQIAAATFPDGEELALLWATINTIVTTESKLQMDWWAAAQLFVPNP